MNNLNPKEVQNIFRNIFILFVEKYNFHYSNGDNNLKRLWIDVIEKLKEPNNVNSKNYIRDYKVSDSTMYDYIVGIKAKETNSLEKLLNLYSIFILDEGIIKKNKKESILIKLKKEEFKSGYKEKYSRLYIENTNTKISKVQEIKQMVNHLKDVSQINYNRLNTIDIVDYRGDKISVKLNSLYVERMEVEDKIKNEINNNDLFVVKGRAGYGKSSFLWHLYDQKNEFFVHKEVCLLDIYNIEDSMIYNCLYDLSNSIILLDTLDAREENRISQTKFQLLISKLIRENNKVIITSREKEADGFIRLFDNKTILELKEYNPDETNDALDNYTKVYTNFHNNVYYDKIKTQYTRMLTGNLHEIASNPLTLRMLFSIYYPSSIDWELLDTKSLYQKYWDIKVYKDNSEYEYIDTRYNSRSHLNCSNSAMMLAVYFHCHHILRCHTDDINNLITKKYINEINILSERGVIKQYDHYYEFFHQTFYEFSLSKAIIKQNKLNQFISDIQLENHFNYYYFNTLEYALIAYLPISHLNGIEIYKLLVSKKESGYRELALHVFFNIKNAILRKMLFDSLKLLLEEDSSIFFEKLNIAHVSQYEYVFNDIIEIKNSYNIQYKSYNKVIKYLLKIIQTKDDSHNSIISFIEAIELVKIVAEKNYKENSQDRTDILELLFKFGNTSYHNWIFQNGKQVCMSNSKTIKILCEFLDKLFQFENNYNSHFLFNHILNNINLKHENLSIEFYIIASNYILRDLKNKTIENSFLTEELNKILTSNTLDENQMIVFETIMVALGFWFIHTDDANFLNQILNKFSSNIQFNLKLAAYTIPIILNKSSENSKISNIVVQYYYGAITTNEEKWTKSLLTSNKSNSILYENGAKRLLSKFNINTIYNSSNVSKYNLISLNFLYNDDKLNLYSLLEKDNEFYKELVKSCRWLIKEWHCPFQEFEKLLIQKKEYNVFVDLFKDIKEYVFEEDKLEFYIECIKKYNSNGNTNESFEIWNQLLLRKFKLPFDKTYVIALIKKLKHFKDVKNLIDILYNDNAIMLNIIELNDIYAKISAYESDGRNQILNSYFKLWGKEKDFLISNYESFKEIFFLHSDYIANKLSLNTFLYTLKIINDDKEKMINLFEEYLYIDPSKHASDSLKGNSLFISIFFEICKHKKIINEYQQFKEKFQNEERLKKIFKQYEADVKTLELNLFVLNDYINLLNQ